MWDFICERFIFNIFHSFRAEFWIYINWGNDYEIRYWKHSLSKISALKVLVSLQSSENFMVFAIDCLTSSNCASDAQINPLHTYNNDRWNCGTAQLHATICSCGIKSNSITSFKNVNHYVNILVCISFRRHFYHHLIDWYVCSCNEVEEMNAYKMYI